MSDILLYEPVWPVIIRGSDALGKQIRRPAGGNE
jgi:hypothetical protein